MQNAILSASGNSSQRSLNILGTLDASASGNSSIRVGVADKNKVNDSVSGNATCKIYRIDDEQCFEATKILSMLQSGSIRGPVSAANTTTDADKDTEVDDSSSSTSTSSSSESSRETAKAATKKRSLHITKDSDKGKKRKT
jgi:hypothetical protein